MENYKQRINKHHKQFFGERSNEYLMKLLKAKRIDPLLIIIIVLAAFLNLYGIWKDQYSNAYYTAAVTSMLQNFHNFFFASFDPGGFVTVDKPPVAFWIQTLFAFIFGVHGWSVILPQALAGVGSVLLIYILVKPSFGKTAARLAALAAACTPIAVAVSRTNNVDSLLVFTLLAATWMLFKAVKTKKWLWCISAFAMIGIGFNIKMLQAYMVLPAFYLFYWLAFKVNWKQKLSILAASTVVLLLVSLSWPLIVDSIPKENRPYIGSSQTNSVLELAFGYNGISRLTGMGGMGGSGGNREGFEDDQPPGQGQDAERQMPDDQQSLQMPGQNGTGQIPTFAGNNPPNQMRDYQGNRGPQGGGMFNTGTAGPLRLFQSQLSGQISWLLPFALLAATGLLMGIRRKQPLTAKQKESLFWLAWLLPMMGFFSIAGFFHQYYLIMLAPAIAVLTGSGWVELSDLYRNSQGWKRFLLPVGLFGTTLFQLYILLPYQNQIGLVLPVAIGVLGSGLSLILCLPRKNPPESIDSNLKHQSSSIDSETNIPATDAKTNLIEQTLPGTAKTPNSLFTKITNIKLKSSIQRTAAAAGMFLLLAAPLYWSATPLLYGGNSMLPETGPQLKSSGNRSAMPNQIPGTTQEQMPDQISGQMPYQTPNQLSGQVQELMPNQLQNRMPGGSQESVDAELLAYLTANNTGEKYLFATTNAGTAEAYIIKTGKAVMAMGGFSGSDPILTVDKLKEMVTNKEVKYFLISSGGPGRGSSEVLTWIRQNGKEIPQTEWQSGTGNSRGDSGMNGSSTLYEVSP